MISDEYKNYAGSVLLRSYVARMNSGFALNLNALSEDG
jgi:hypothetical protein